MRKYTKKSEYLTKLKRIIDAVNELPDDSEDVERIHLKLMHIEARLKADTDESLKENLDKIPSEIVELIGEDKVFNYVTEGYSETRKLYSLTNVCRNFYQLIIARTMLEKIVMLNEPLPKRPNRILDRFSDFIRKVKLEMELSSITSAGLLIDDGGYIRPNLKGLAAIFDEHDIPYQRIRRCPICSKIFWVRRIEKRVDAQACENKKCSDVLSQRRYQAKKKKINEQRRDNRQTVKEGKAVVTKRGQNDGTS